MFIVFLWINTLFTKSSRTDRIKIRERIDNNGEFNIFLYIKFGKWTETNKTIMMMMVLVSEANKN